MPQLLLQGFPDDAIRIGSTLSVLKKEGRGTEFVGPDNDFFGRRGVTPAFGYGAPHPSAEGTYAS
jgi:hypothetical protein